MKLNFYLIKNCRFLYPISHNDEGRKMECKQNYYHRVENFW